MILSCVLWNPVDIPQWWSWSLNSDFLKPLVGCPSHTSNRSTTSLGSSPPKTLLSAHVSSIFPYFEILSVGSDPFEPILLTIPLGPISLTCSRAAFFKGSDHLKGFIAFWLRRNSIASTYAIFPSFVSMNERPSSEYKIAPLNRPRHFSKWGINDLGLLRTLFWS